MAQLFTVTSEHLPMIMYSHHHQYYVREPANDLADLFAPETPAGMSESGTPATPAPTEQDDHFLRFTTKHVPKSLSVGFVFGSSPNQCDVLLHPSRNTGISGTQFAVTFNHKTGATLIVNLSKQGTRVQFPGDSRRTLMRSQSTIDKGILVCFKTYTLSIFPIREEGAESAAAYASYFARLGNILPDIDRMRVSSSGHRTEASTQEPYQLGIILASGSYGVVHHALHSQTGDSVAIKCFTRSRHRAKPYMEGSLLGSLNHEHIIGFRELLLRRDEEPRLVMEFAALGDMGTQHLQCRFVAAEAKIIISQVLKGLAYLHGRRIVHRDLKPDNILVMSRNPIHIKLGDFGEACNDKDEFVTFAGTLRYAAPEITRPPYTNKVDIWSLGIIVEELWIGLPKYLPNQGRWYNVVLDTCGLAAGTLLEFLRCTVHLSPERRFTAEQCQQLKFLTTKYHELRTPRNQNEDDLTVKTALTVRNEIPDTAIPDSPHDQRNPPAVNYSPAQVVSQLPIANSQKGFLGSFEFPVDTIPFFRDDSNDQVPITAEGEIGSSPGVAPHTPG